MLHSRLPITLSQTNSTGSSRQRIKANSKKHRVKMTEYGTLIRIMNRTINSSNETFTVSCAVARSPRNKQFRTESSILHLSRSSLTPFSIGRGSFSECPELSLRRVSSIAGINKRPRLSPIRIIYFVYSSNPPARHGKYRRREQKKEKQFGAAEGAGTLRKDRRPFCRLFTGITGNC